MSIEMKSTMVSPLHVNSIYSYTFVVQQQRNITWQYKTIAVLKTRLKNKTLFVSLYRRFGFRDLISTLFDAGTETWN